MLILIYYLFNEVSSIVSNSKLIVSFLEFLLGFLFNHICLIYEIGIFEKLAPGAFARNVGSP